MKFCKKCVMPDTRPRLTYNSEGICAACEWAEIKKNEINWEQRQQELRELCDSIRGKQKYDCIVPASGGKDSTYVADKMKNVYGLNILTVTITPPLETELIQNNMKNFLNYGYDNIKVTLYTFLFILHKKACVLAIRAMIHKVSNNDKHSLMGENCVISGSMHIVFQS